MEQQSIIDFNELQNQLAETFNPNSAKTQAKEMIANMLLFMAVPFFANRLKEKIPADIFDRLQKAIADPETAGTELMSLTKSLFQEKVLQPLKTQLLDRAKQYVPELRDIDIENLSMEQVQNLVEKGILSRMKARLPAELADKLPESFNLENITTALKSVSKETALKFAKDNLPAEAYQQLENNTSLIENPASIAEYIKTKLGQAQTDIKNTISDMKTQAVSKLEDVKSQLKAEIENKVQPIRDNIEKLKSARNDLKVKYNESRSALREKYNDIKARTEEFKQNTPDYSPEDLKPFQDQAKSVLDEGTRAFEKFNADDADLGQQITDGMQSVQNFTNNLISRANDLSSTTLGRVNQIKQDLASKVSQIKEQTSTGIDDLQNTGASLIEQAKPEIAMVQKRATSFLNQAEQLQEPDFFGKLMNKAKAFKPSRVKISTQDEILNADPEAETPFKLNLEPIFQAQSQAQQIRASMLAKAQEVLPTFPKPAPAPESAPTEPATAPVEEPKPILPVEEATSPAEGLSTLMEATASLEAIPGVDILSTLVDIGGLIGSIFGAKSLMKEHQSTPLEVGSSYEPNF